MCIRDSYKAAVDRLFEALRGSERDRSMNRFKEKVSTLRSTGDKRFYNIVYNVRSVYKNVCLCSHAERASDIRR